MRYQNGISKSGTKKEKGRSPGRKLKDKMSKHLEIEKTESHSTPRPGDSSSLCHSLSTLTVIYYTLCKPDTRIAEMIR